jgi:hypothetical protein
VCRSLRNSLESILGQRSVSAALSERVGVVAAYTLVPFGWKPYRATNIREDSAPARGE